MVKIELNTGKIIHKKDYIMAMTIVYQKMGNTALAENDIAEQLEKIIKGERLTIVGMFMRDKIKRVFDAKTKETIYAKT